MRQPPNIESPIAQQGAGQQAAVTNPMEQTRTDAVFTNNYGRTTVVFVTDQFHCERLISAGRRIANATRTTLLVINIERNSIDCNSAAIEHLYQVSKENDAEMTVFYEEDDVVGVMSRCLRENNACHVVTGMPQDEDSILKKIWRLHPAINFYTVTYDNQIVSVPIVEKLGRRAKI